MMSSASLVSVAVSIAETEPESGLTTKRVAPSGVRPILLVAEVEIGSPRTPQTSNAGRRRLRNRGEMLYMARLACSSSISVSPASRRGKTHSKRSRSRIALGSGATGVRFRNSEPCSVTTRAA